MEKAILLVSPFLVQALAIVLNFNSLLQGSAANVINVAVSLGFFIFWVFFLNMIKRTGIQRALLFSLVFWGIFFLTAFFAALVNIFDYDLPTVIPFTVLFLSPAYGVQIAQLSNVAALTIMALIALAYVVYIIAVVKDSTKNRLKR